LNFRMANQKRLSSELAHVGGEPTPAARMDAIAGRGPFSGSYAYTAPDRYAGMRAAGRLRRFK
jgi:hypothetical protein